MSAPEAMPFKKWPPQPKGQKRDCLLLGGVAKQNIKRTMRGSNGPGMACSPRPCPIRPLISLQKSPSWGRAVAPRDGQLLRVAAAGPAALGGVESEDEFLEEALVGFYQFTPEQLQRFQRCAGRGGDASGGS